MKEQELNALLKLLADSDEFVVETAKNRLFEDFKNIEQKVLAEISNSDDDIFKNNANDLVRIYNFRRVKTKLYEWKMENRTDLVRGLFYITKLYYHDLDYNDFFNYFDKLKRGVCCDIQNLTPIEQVRQLNFILYKSKKFNIFFEEFEVDSLMLNKAFETYNTSAFLMNIIYYILAKKLDIPLYLVKNKGILLLAYYKIKDSSETPTRIVYDFFVNPADRGFLITQDAIYKSFLIENNKLEKDFTVLTNSEIVSILLDKLILLAQKENNENLEDNLNILREIILTD